MPTIDAFVQHHATLRILFVKHGMPCFPDMSEMQDASAGGLLGPGLILVPPCSGKSFLVRKLRVHVPQFSRILEKI